MYCDVYRCHMLCCCQNKINQSIKKPLMNKELRQAMFRKRCAYNRAKKDRKNKTKWEDYRSKRNQFVALKKVSMKRYFKERCSNPGKARNFWDTLRPYLSNKNKSQDCIKLQEGDRITSDPKQVADAFNNFFSSVTSGTGITEDFDNLCLNDIINHYCDHPSVKTIEENHQGKSFSFNTVSDACVLKTLRNINPHKSTGYDMIPPKLLKLGASVLASPLTDLVNMFLRKGCFPSALKKAEVTPIFKKDNKLDKSKYRPVSILSSIAIVVERIVSEQLNVFFNDIFHDNLSAYRKCYNTQSVVLKSVEDWKISLDNNLCTGAVCIDLSKAFDVIPHGLLLAKLNAYGCDNNVLEFFYSYLNDRKQRVKVENNFSEWSTIVKGVPQGSVIGPSAFNVFINDVFHVTVKSADTDATVEQTPYNASMENQIHVLLSLIQN